MVGDGPDLRTACRKQGAPISAAVDVEDEFQPVAGAAGHAAVVVPQAAAGTLDVAEHAAPSFAASFAVDGSCRRSVTP